MANLDLQKYGKKELIQMIIAKEDEIQKLKVEVQAIKTELENKNIESNTIGSIATAGESVSSIFAEAQRTAEKYISSIEYRKENFGRICLTIWFSANSFKNSSCGTYAINRNDVREIGTNQKFLDSPPFTFKHAEYVFLSSTIKRAFI